NHSVHPLEQIKLHKSSLLSDRRSAGCACGRLSSRSARGVSGLPSCSGVITGRCAGEKRSSGGRLSTGHFLFITSADKKERAAMHRLDIILFSDLPSRLVSHCTGHPTESSSPNQRLKCICLRRSSLTLREPRSAPA